MIRKLSLLKNRVVQFYDFLKAMDEMPMRRLLGDFYEEKEPRRKAVRRETKTSVEDLRPQKNTEQ
ncbi:hypothetical protein [Bdellovibrio bacteriovorus]|uniref:Uncharacterized protein n=1 Tax=Bdellovibrio bacteriovorus str. Tiberius TaxID=1069642 RepID=K7YXY5_BDEBC|nr:hypothetical protein [Bdellovibrio bacteriovorus]AFY02528.1 hypothetical protein Bdt_2848 [Bdellovibrio bacteriovorus str. Tiberius]